MSKFKIPPRAPTTPATSGTPVSIADFTSGAALVQSQAGARPPKPVRLNLDLDPDIHRQLKLRAVHDGTTVAELVRGLIKRELEWQAK
jgi:hypothetical protein